MKKNISTLFCFLPLIAAAGTFVSYPNTNAIGTGDTVLIAKTNTANGTWSNYAMNFPDFQSNVLQSGKSSKFSSQTATNLQLYGDGTEGGGHFPTIEMHGSATNTPTWIKFILDHGDPLGSSHFEGIARDFGSGTVAGQARGMSTGDFMSIAFDSAVQLDLIKYGCEQWNIGQISFGVGDFDSTYDSEFTFYDLPAITFFGTNTTLMHNWSISDAAMTNGMIVSSLQNNFDAYTSVRGSQPNYGGFFFHLLQGNTTEDWRGGYEGGNNYNLAIFFAAGSASSANSPGTIELLLDPNDGFASSPIPVWNFSDVAITNVPALMTTNSAPANTVTPVTWFGISNRGQLFKIPAYQ